MSTLAQILARTNKRLAELGAEPLICLPPSPAASQQAAVQEPDISAWDAFMQRYAHEHKDDEALLKGPPRPIHEEWNDIDEMRWVADGQGRLHSLAKAEAIDQSDASGFVRETFPRSRQATVQDLEGLMMKCTDLGWNTAEIWEMLKRAGGPFGPVSWIAKSRAETGVQEIEQSKKRSEKSTQQTRQFAEREAKRAKRHFTRN